MDKTEPELKPAFRYAVLIAGAALIRLFSILPANFSPVGAMGLFAGAHMRWPAALCVSVLTLFATDCVLGLYHPVAMLFNYMGMGIGVLLGHAMLSNKKTLLLQVSAATFGAVAFFILSNFGVWLSGELYPLTSAGLLLCFAAAVPFFQASLSANLLFTLLLFGLNHVSVCALTLLSGDKA